MRRRSIGSIQVGAIGLGGIGRASALADQELRDLTAHRPSPSSTPHQEIS
ncbi:MAG TPA: hypothetical protein VIT41_07770 [Microlunatus sp.]